MYTRDCLGAMWKHAAPLRIFKNTFLASALWGSVRCPTADRQPADCNCVCLCIAGSVLTGGGDGVGTNPAADHQV